MVRRFCDVEIRVVASGYDDDLTDGVARGDLGFVVGDRGDRFESVSLFDDPHVLVARPGEFEPGPVAVGALAGVPMIGQHENTCQLISTGGLRLAGVEPGHVFRTNGTVIAGPGVARPRPVASSSRRRHLVAPTLSVT